MIANITLYTANTEKSCFLIQLSKNLIENIPTTNAINTPINVSILNARFPTSKIVAPAIIGTESKKVNFVAALFDNPINLAANIVVPLLENPGIIASA